MGSFDGKLVGILFVSNVAFGPTTMSAGQQHFDHSLAILFDDECVHSANWSSSRSMCLSEVLGPDQFILLPYDKWCWELKFDYKRVSAKGETFTKEFVIDAIGKDDFSCHKSYAPFGHDHAQFLRFRSIELIDGYQLFVVMERNFDRETHRIIVVRWVEVDYCSKCSSTQYGSLKMGKNDKRLCDGCQGSMTSREVRRFLE